MAHWTPAPGFCYYLGIDENDPAATLNLAWYSDGVTWQKVSSIPLGSPGVFVLRVTAMINDGMDLINLDPAPGHPDTPEVSDSMVIAGYNVYRKAPVNDSSFIRINADPVIDSQYIDNQFYGTYAGYYYYVTCLYNLASTNNFLCESRGTDTLFVSLIVGVGENKERTSLKVFPVPANSIINIKSDKIITGVEIDDHLGTIKMVEGNLRNHEYSIPVERLYPGLYFLKVMTGQDVITRKILVMR
jgi:hypothetical protein